MYIAFQALCADRHGVVQVVARSAKFSLFDPAKEMVYIEMSKEEKQQGKAAVDLVGSQVCFASAIYIYIGYVQVPGPYACIIDRQGVDRWYAQI